MLRILADENFHNGIVRALQRHRHLIDVVRAQDVGLGGVDDPTLLAWCAQEQRILFTHDVRTITRYAYERVTTGRPMTGVFEVPRGAPFARVIEDILLIAGASEGREWDGQVHYLPL